MMYVGYSALFYDIIIILSLYYHYIIIIYNIIYLYIIVFEPCCPAHCFIVLTALVILSKINE